MTQRAALLVTLVPLLAAGTSARPKTPAHAEFGRVTGTVEVSAALTARRPRFRVYADAGPGAVPPAPPARYDLRSELRNVVVYIATPYPVADAVTSFADSLPRGSMAQVDERFEPHVLPVLAGAKVDFPNRDDVYHNVFSLSSVRTFDLGRYPKGSSKAVTFTKPGVVQVFCHIHSDMSAVILVLANDRFAAPDSAGHYVIDGVPPGEYVVVGWHERTRPVAQHVRVTAGSTTEINFSLPLEQRTAAAAPPGG